MSERDETAETNENAETNEDAPTEGEVASKQKASSEAASDGASPADEPAQAQDAAAEPAEEEAEKQDEEQDEAELHDTTVEVLPDETGRLRQQLEEASARLRAVSKAYKDLQTEMDAFRRRQQVLAEAKAEKRAAQVVERFFEPVQNLRRAVEQEDVSAADLKQGVQMVLKQFVGRMEELGLAEIPGVGAPFDPQVHDALAQLPVTDEGMNGKVIEVYATGWKVGERVIQPAQVVVGVYQEPGEA